MRTLVAALMIVLLVGGASAQSVQRKIPADALLGKITKATASQVEIDGKVYRLAPGTRIVNQRNLTVTPNMIQKNAPARYTLDEGGNVRAIWLVDEDDRTGTAPVQRTPGTN